MSSFNIFQLITQNYKVKNRFVSFFCLLMFVPILFANEKSQAQSTEELNEPQLPSCDEWVLKDHFTYQVESVKILGRGIDKIYITTKKAQEIIIGKSNETNTIIINPDEADDVKAQVINDLKKLEDDIRKRDDMGTESSGEDKVVLIDLITATKTVIGENYTSPRLSLANRLVFKVLEEHEQKKIDLNQGVISVQSVFSDACPTSDSKVAIEVRPYYLRIDLLNVGDNILPIPRANTPTFSVGIPPELLATSPVVGVLNDRNYGTSLGLKTSTNLLDLPPEPNRESSEALNLDLDARHSLSQTFYNLDTKLEYNTPNSLVKIRPNVAMGYSNQLSPLGEGEEWQQKVQLKGGIQQRLNQSFIRNYTVGGGVSYLDNNYTPRRSETLRNSDTGLQLYGVADTRPLGDGFVRFGAWADAGFPSDAGSYQRLAVQSAYATEIGSGHNTVGLQIMAGSGYAFGNPPEYGQYFGGSLASNFLYESLQSSRIRSFPSGPIIRSFGEQQAGLRGSDGLIVGGNFYWHLNFNLAFPVPGWYKPLIPEEITSDTEFKELLKGSINSSKTITEKRLESDFIKQGDDVETAEARAKAEVTSIFDEEVQPTIDRLMKQTNLYSVKPMLLFDLAQISGDNGAGSKLWAGVGGGLQVNLVNGRLETGYMHTVAPSSDADVGNFFIRLVFTDF